MIIVESIADGNMHKIVLFCKLQSLYHMTVLLARFTDSHSTPEVVI